VLEIVAKAQGSQAKQVQGSKLPAGLVGYLTQVPPEDLVDVLRGECRS